MTTDDKPSSAPPPLPDSTEQLQRLREKVDEAIRAFRVLAVEFESKASHLRTPVERRGPDPWESEPVVGLFELRCLMARFDLVRDYLSANEEYLVDLCFESMKRKLQPLQASASEETAAIDVVADVAQKAQLVVDTLKKLDSRIYQSASQISESAADQNTQSTTAVADQSHGAPTQSDSLTSDAPQPVAVSPSQSVLLFSQRDRPIVRGERKEALTKGQYNVVRILLEAGRHGLTKDELNRKSRHGDARGILKRLAKKNAAWESVISFPGVTGGGYRII